MGVYPYQRDLDAPCHGDVGTATLAQGPWRSDVVMRPLARRTCSGDLVVGTWPLGPCRGGPCYRVRVKKRSLCHEDLVEGTLSRGPCRRDVETETLKQRR
ncbi:hypothetical protein M885DRAFT_503501 [Pelagophyceae sp. CCMP2097]|nr:hypothetical protein M885DRAFT_503501 [Pelagophyceae sp. CCMP2097]